MHGCASSKAVSNSCTGEWQDDWNDISVSEPYIHACVGFTSLTPKSLEKLAHRQTINLRQPNTHAIIHTFILTHIHEYAYIHTYVRRVYMREYKRTIAYMFMMYMGMICAYITLLPVQVAYRVIHNYISFNATKQRILCLSVVKCEFFYIKRYNLSDTVMPVYSSKLLWVNKQFCRETRFLFPTKH